MMKPWGTVETVEGENEAAYCLSRVVLPTPMGPSRISLRALRSAYIVGHDEAADCCFYRQMCLHANE